jgi:hypothetical protein
MKPIISRFYKIALCLLVVLGATVSRSLAQEKMGMVNSNYWSSHSIFLNPVSSVDSKTYIQVNVVGLNAYAMTNAAYLSKFWIYKPEVNLEKSSLRLHKFAYAAGSVEGLSFVISKRNYGAGLFVRARGVATLRAGSYELLNLLLGEENARKGSVKIDDRNVGFSSMSWIEYGVNFGMMAVRRRNTIISVGGNLRYLSGLTLTYANLNRIRIVYNDSTLKVDEIKGRTRFSDYGFKAGGGIGMDIGLTYKSMLEPAEGYYAHSERNNCRNIDYKYRLSVVLRDAGYIRFKKGTSGSDISAGVGDMANNLDLGSFSSNSFKNQPILASLPTALIAQLDWNFENKIYLSGTAIKNIIPARVTGAQGPDLLCIAPRFELWKFEASLPVTLQRFIYPQLGLGLRWRTFVLGFDNVFPLMFKKNTYGVGAYLSIGFSWFHNPACNVKPRSVDSCPPKRKGKSGRKMKTVKPRSDHKKIKRFKAGA